MLRMKHYKKKESCVDETVFGGFLVVFDKIPIYLNTDSVFLKGYCLYGCS